MTTREQTCSTTSSTCELKTTILPAVGQRANERLQHARGGDVESRERLVEDDDARIVEHRGGDQDLLAHALRALRERLVAVVPEAEPLEEPIDLRS